MLKRLILILLLGHILLKVNAEEYWQQDVHYTIDVELNDSTHELLGFINMKYINNSPDVLNQIYIHLWPNAYKNNNTAFAKQLLENGNTSFYFSSPEEKGFIDQIDFKINDKEANWQFDSAHIDIAKIMLSQPLESNDSITISTPFHVKIPQNFSRLGHRRQAYQITQWYPKPAVYDKAGWHPMPYLDQGEFFSEFGSFDVNITLPKNYVVAATGDLQNEEELKWLEEKTLDTSELKKDIPSDSTYKTLRYIQKNVHDFAWFADKRYKVDQKEIILPNSGSTVTGWAFHYGRNSWEESTTYIERAIINYSNWLGDYPYNQVSVVEGPISAGGGMEYPNVTIIDYGLGKEFLLDVIVHEVGHNWWYGILAPNERDHPWIDEGFNSFYERRCTQLIRQEDSLTKSTEQFFNHKLFSTKEKKLDEMQLAYNVTARLKRDQPLDIPSDQYTHFNYGIIVYGKTAICLDHLKNHLGKEAFDQIMQDFFEIYKFKHIYPEDLQKYFENNASQYTGWLFNKNGIRGTTRQVDYLLKRVDTVIIGKSPFYEITIINEGKVKSPYQINAYIKDSIARSIWYDGHKPKYKKGKNYPASSGEAKILFPYDSYDRFSIDAGPLEVNNQNNSFYKRPVFKKIDPVRLQSLFTLGNPNRSELTFSPISGWNKYDKTMVGLALYNGLIIPKKIEYVLAPMFSTNTNQLVGLAKVGFNHYWEHDKRADNLYISISGKRFHHNITPEALSYNRLALSSKFTFSEPIARSTSSHSFHLNNILVSREYTSFDFANNDFTKQSLNYLVNRLSYTYSNHKNIITPYALGVRLEQGDQYLKTSLAFNYSLTYNKKAKKINARLFVGGFIFNNNTTFDNRFRLSGIRGFQDYTYDYLYLERNDIYAKQFVTNDGAFKILTPIGQSRSWLASANLKGNLPFTRWIDIFADIGLSETATSIQYDAGLSLTIVPEIAAIHFPIFVSKDIAESLEANNRSKFTHRISIELNLNGLNPFELTKRFK